jgi:hypothetical protein
MKKEAAISSIMLTNIYQTIRRDSSGVLQNANSMFLHNEDTHYQTTRRHIQGNLRMPAVGSSKTQINVY